MKIQLRIDRLVLDGVEVADQGAFTAELEAALAERVRGGVADLAGQTSRAIDRVAPTGRGSTDRGVAGPRSSAAVVADGIWSAVTGGTAQGGRP